MSANKGFVVYAELDNLEFGHQKSRPNHAAIVSINFDDGTYEYLDTKSLYPERIYELITHPAPDTVMFMSFRRAEVGDDPIKLHIYKFDDSIKKIKHEKSIDILRSYHFFHLLDEKIVFVRINLRLNFNETIFEAIMYIDHNDRCLEIPNTGVCLKPRPSLDITDIGRVSIQICYIIYIFRYHALMKLTGTELNYSTFCLWKMPISRKNIQPWQFRSCGHLK